MALVLGIDPGTVRTGFGAVRIQDNRFSFVDCGVIRPPARWPLADRLHHIFDEMVATIRRLSPDELAVEDSFHGSNVKSALKLGQARGVALVAGKHCGLPIAEYPPATVKLAITGYGRAEKEQVAYMVARLLGTSLEAAAGDATDALAVAICHASNRRAWGGQRTA